MSVGRNDNADPEATNLELSLGFSNNHNVSSRSSGQGVGVNASRVDMTYDPLSELVWSPHYGLALKCTDCSFITKSPPLIWEVGPSKLADKGKLVTSQASLVVTPSTFRGIVPPVTPNFGHFLGKTGLMDEVNSIRKENASKNDEEEGILRGNDKDPNNCKTVDFLSLGTNKPLLPEDKGSSMPIPIPSSSTPKGQNKDLVLDTENKNETDVDYSIERLEHTAENELPLDENARCTSEERLRKGKSVQIEASPAFSKTLLDREKGKEKVFSKGESSKTNSKEKDGSDESVESCSSVGIVSVGQKRDRFEQQLISESKRVKHQIQEDPVSTSFMGQRSSFMNWISNMVKGLNRVDLDEEPSHALPLPDIEGHEGGVDKKMVSFNQNNDQRGPGDMGFRTIFRSIYCPKPYEMEINATNENTSVGETNEFELADRVTGPNATPVLCHGDQVCADLAEARYSSNSETHANKSDNPENMWITRFSPKSYENLVNLDGPSVASKMVNDRSDEISSFESKHILTSSNLKNKEVMASVFAKRLGALKNITSSDIIGDTTQTRGTCFYCGKLGHDLRDCSEITETNRDYFVKSMSAYVGIEESCFCLWCFQVDHWAISCPKGLSGIDKSVYSTSCNHVVRGVELLEETNRIFDSIRKLRLSRTDIHRWMNSRSSLSSLDGFFLRLRLGKWENGNDGTGYYVACITGDQKGKQIQGSKSPISVDVVGKSCLVESQYISNQDFLEDELTAWWSSTVKNGGTIPSGEDLKVKIEERMRLGF